MFFFSVYMLSADGTYAMKKFMIHSKEQLELVKQEIRVSSQFNHPNLLPLLDHAIISVKVIYFIRNSNRVS
jgi:serine/threonine kinase 16